VRAIGVVSAMNADYERGFNAGFAEAAARTGRARDGGCTISADDSGGKKIAISLNAAQFSFVEEYRSAMGCSFAAAVRGLIEKLRHANTNPVEGKSFGLMSQNAATQWDANSHCGRGGMCDRPTGA